MDAWSGGFSNVWLAASQLETAVYMLMLVGTRLVLKGDESCWTFADGDLFDSVCFCAALLSTGKVRWG